MTALTAASASADRRKFWDRLHSAARRLAVVRPGLCFWGVLLLAAAPVGAAEQLHAGWATDCLPSRVNDGDSFTCNSTDRGSFRVRLAGADAPETGQAYWKRAREEFRAQLGAGRVRVGCYKTDRHGREVCRVRVSGTDVVPALLSSGLAWHATAFLHEQTPDEQALYAFLEARAQRAKVGLWAQPSPMPPDECRKLKRQGEAKSCR